MDLVNQQHDAVPLAQLVSGTLRQLEKVGYSDGSVVRCRSVLSRLVEFARANGFGDVYSDQLVNRFKETWDASADPVDLTDSWRRYVSSATKHLANFSRGDLKARRRTDAHRLAVPPAMQKQLRDFEVFCRERCHLGPKTVKQRVRDIERFFDFLGSRHVERLHDLRRDHLTAFIAWRGRGLGPSTRRQTVTGLKFLLRFATFQGILAEDLSYVLPSVHVPRQRSIPSVWDSELVVKLLAVVDRSSPKGKRDYAMLLLAARLGLRVSDLLALKLEDLNWEASTVQINQVKTGEPLQLPLSEELGEAIIDYLKFARPETQHRHVFLSLRRPWGPFQRDDGVYHIIDHWREAAGIRFRKGQPRGFHSLRHTLATELLREQTPIQVISEILGHTKTGSTLIYAKADTEALRGAALDMEEPSDEQ